MILEIIKITLQIYVKTETSEVDPTSEVFLKVFDLYRWLLRSNIEIMNVEMIIRIVAQ